MAKTVWAWGITPTLSQSPALMLVRRRRPERLKDRLVTELERLRAGVRAEADAIGVESFDDAADRRSGR